MHNIYIYTCSCIHMYMCRIWTYLHTYTPMLLTGASCTASWPLCFDVSGGRRIYDRYDTLPLFFLNEKKTQKAGGNFVVLAHNNARSSNWWPYIVRYNTRNCCRLKALPLLMQKLFTIITHSSMQRYPLHVILSQNPSILILKRISPLALLLLSSSSSSSSSC